MQHGHWHKREGFVSNQNHNPFIAEQKAELLLKDSNETNRVKAQLH